MESLTHAVETGDDLAGLPNLPAVFALWPAEGEPYLSKTGMLRRRLLRLLAERERPSRLLNLRQTVRRIEYQITGSAFESAVVLYRQARRLFPGANPRFQLRILDCGQHFAEQRAGLIAGAD